MTRSGLLRDLGPDILIATHSTEIISDAEPEDIVLVDKRKQAAQRIDNAGQLTQVFSVLGSALNPTITQLAKTRRVVFVEGKDFKIISRFARKAGFPEVAHGANFAVLPIEGFNPERARNMKAGIEASLGTTIRAAVVLDRDYRSDAEVNQIKKQASAFCEFAIIHDRKEIENFLLVPSAIDRAAMRRVVERVDHTGEDIIYDPVADQILSDYAEAEKANLTAQCQSYRTKFARKESPGIDASKVLEQALKELNPLWSDPSQRLRLIPGKAALTAVNEALTRKYKISLTPSAIIEAMHQQEVPDEMRALLGDLTTFSRLAP